MYHYNQIIYSRILKRPIKATDKFGQWATAPIGQTTHFIKSSPRKSDLSESGFEIALPETVEEAQMLMDRGLIVPAPVEASHHWRCGNWKSRCRCEDKS